MTKLKPILYGICNDVASEFPGWRFVSGEFKSAALPGVEAIINPGFYFRDGSTPLQPSIRIRHRKTVSMFKKLFGYEWPTSIVVFQDVAQLLVHMPRELRIIATILLDKKLQMKLAPPKEPAGLVGVEEVKPVLRAMMQDGIRLINDLYDMNSELEFLKNLPPKYETRHINIPYDEFERQKGVMLCVVHALLGDFNFFERYSSEDYETIFPKRTAELNKLAGALPTLKAGFVV